MFFSNYSFEMLPVYICRALAMLLVIPVHESAHAFVSWKLGDATAKNYGRLSLNPLRHFDVMGVICMIFVGFGWAKPVPIGAHRFKNPKRDMALSAAAGPISNIILAFFSMIIYKLVFYLWYAQAPQSAAAYYVFLFWQIMISLNVMLAVFNMLPVPPLDGSRIFLTFLPQRVYFQIMQYERYIMMALFALLIFGVLDGPLRLMNNFVWDILFKSTGFVEILLGIR